MSDEYSYENDFVKDDKQPVIASTVWIVLQDSEGWRDVEVLDEKPSLSLVRELRDMLRAGTLVYAEIRVANINGGDSNVVWYGEAREG
jgi:hypothetical protein